MTYSKLAHASIGFLLSIMPLYANAEPPQPASKESIQTLMQTTGAENMAKQMAVQIIPMLKKLVPEAPDRFWEDFFKEINAEQINELIIPIYQKYLTEQDVQAINAFYQSPVGQKLIRVQPQISKESMVAGQLWGQQIAQKVIKKYQQQQKQQSTPPQ
ncbi:DUF2059 domain-containing protein [Hydrogenovibrio sp. 3SP14C1]|uniref:DUF2059 domain-containing protein n=1 Tax=Hydrogenovibrio sp. 3SP14C1 TaxID=3038774 RepID=UPI002415C236|nr:DUF2059 domain-containing protein [Hydrogenovibrio sp. 3SP14C1]MDG4811415.1 DUF2059 domain-containing protein [Hydrogenovibrio sp. 3SP14C1]